MDARDTTEMEGASPLAVPALMKYDGEDLKATPRFRERNMTERDFALMRGASLLRALT